MVWRGSSSGSKSTTLEPDESVLLFPNSILCFSKIPFFLLYIRILQAASGLCTCLHVSRGRPVSSLCFGQTNYFFADFDGFFCGRFDVFASFWEGRQCLSGDARAVPRIRNPSGMFSPDINVPLYDKNRISGSVT